MSILQIQSMLRSVGYTPGMQGNLCTQTKRSLKAFQRDFKLFPSGVPDKETIKKLEHYYDYRQQHH